MNIFEQNEFIKIILHFHIFLYCYIIHGTMRIITILGIRKLIKECLTTNFRGLYI